MSKEEFEKRKAQLLAAASATPAGSPSRAGEDRRRTASGRPDALPPARKRSENPQYYRAPYRFVPYDAKLVVLAEKEALLPIDEPHADKLSAEIDIAWEAETPLLIGAEQEGGTVVPVSWKGSGQTLTYIVPATTIRGAIRSVCEIVGGASMTFAQVNADQSFAIRDFTHRAYGKPVDEKEASDDGSTFGISSTKNIRAGWIRRVGPANRGDEALEEVTFAIEPAGDWYYIEGKSLWSSGAIRGARIASIEDFYKLPIAEKYASINFENKRCIDPDSRNRIATRQAVFRFNPVGSKTDGGRVVALMAGGSIEGHLVFSGKAPSPRQRRYEYVFARSDRREATAIKPELWSRFVKSQSQYVGDKLRPEGGWKELAAMFAADPDLELPVFYVGDLGLQLENKFAFGFTRLFKVPHTKTLKKVLEESGVKSPTHSDGPVDRTKLDMVDALFGYVYEPETGLPDGEDPSEYSRKGRIAFDHGEVPNDPKLVRRTGPIETVMSGPKPSFSPFYLSGNWKDYSAPGDTIPTIAGRKRYPVRHQPDRPQDNETSVRKSLREQVEAVKAMSPGGRVSEKVLSRLDFLVPAPNAKSLKFTSRIRLFNVTDAELGLVLEAVTLCGDDSLRHAIGRGKPFGAGQIKATVKSLRVQYNRDTSVADHGADREARAHFRDAFAAHVERQLGDKANELRANVETFLAMCDPEVGAEMKRQGKLDYLRLREPVPNSNRPDNPYQVLRDQVKPTNDQRVYPAGGPVLLKMERRQR
ncbi:TIGR03986 family CRISPR-associated RAMP protein [Aquibium microcysteis]|uniref:TIGR03986 family type III CRISPR-associated RAMP protein n=1 Tax=Aquibium microcysteis TaxID=675281 RepID=UPI001EF1A1A5|nr:TIGR03986 family CRISPR-associated RAMP protein [Aquibium microcysteis]